MIFFEKEECRGDKNSKIQIFQVTFLFQNFSKNYLVKNFLDKNLPNFVYPVLILHNQSHASVQDISAHIGLDTFLVCLVKPLSFISFVVFLLFKFRVLSIQIVNNSNNSNHVHIFKVQSRDVEN